MKSLSRSNLLAIFCISIAILCLLGQDNNIAPMIELNKLAIVSHAELYRLFTFAFTHTTDLELAINMFGLAILVMLILTATFTCVTAALLLYSDIVEIRGFSGTLHGLYFFYSVKSVLSGHKEFALMAIAILIKVHLERLYGVPVHLVDLYGIPLATEPHFIAVNVALLAVLVQLLFHPLVAFSFETNTGTFKGQYR
ncbi:hypothetical protein [Vibrio sp.]|uniref:hypothetical protein n=1 Tax=Vibrio sp. TaxID=678 RepID=UPI003D0BAD09